MAYGMETSRSSMLSYSVVSVCKVVQISFFVDHDSLLISYLHLSQSKKVFFLYNNKFSGTKRFSTMAARMLQRDRHFKRGKLSTVEGCRGLLQDGENVNVLGQPDQGHSKVPNQKIRNGIDDDSEDNNIMDV